MVRLAASTPRTQQRRHLLWSLLPLDHKDQPMNHNAAEVAIFVVVFAAVVWLLVLLLPA
jgi:hypothetical protein